MERDRDSTGTGGPGDSPAPLSVAFVNSTHRWRGVKSWTLRVATGLERRGHKVHLFIARGNVFAAAAREAGLEVTEVRFGPDWNPLAVRALRHGLASAGTQVVVTNVSKDNRTAGPASRALRLPILQRVGASGDLRDRWKVRLEQRRYVDRIVVPARVIADRLRAFPWLDAGRRVSVIANGIDLERFRPGIGQGTLRRELGLDDATPLVVAASQISPVKGIPVLIEAFATLPALSPSPHLILIGEGDAESASLTQARRLGAADRVHALGFRRDLDLLLEDADLVAHPSMFDGEGLPNSVLEAMAKGKAIVATRIGGTGEAVEHGVEALLVEPGDAAGLSAALRDLLTDSELRARLGRAARGRAERDFDERAMVARMEALLLAVRETGPRRSAAS
ncbi:MAG: glycosyltransferase family 4 protein [Planctomycetota bacterium]